MHHLTRTGGDGEGADWGCVGDQQVRLDVRLVDLSALANRRTWMDNGAALHRSKV
ncbi:MAG: hypothetical protein GY832_21605 [Chloroflexi bacterium]|nr:hypothetical protein [Chloroflexota bacterium]